MNAEDYPTSHVNTEELVPKAPNTYGNFSFTLKKVCDLVSDYGVICSQVEKNRRVVDYDIDNQTLKSSGDLEEDELLLPIRLIKKNIKRKTPAYLEALVGTQEVLTLKCLESPAISGDKLNEEITKRLRDNKWLRAHMLNINGFLTHGLSWIVTEFDPTTPSNVKNVRFKKEDVLIPTDLEDVQAAEMITLRLVVTPTKIRELVEKEGFNKEVADEAIKDRTVSDGTSKKENCFHIFKVFYKSEGAVWVGWIAHEKSQTWLKEPKPLYLGRGSAAETGELEPLPEVEYPIDPFFLSLPESNRILDSQGLAEDTGPLQEASTLLMSSHINATVRSSSLYGALEETTEDDMSDGPKQLDVKLKANTILNRKIRSFQVQQPDRTAIEGLSFIEQLNADEQQQITAVLHSGRGDRKTAREIDSAQHQTSLASTQDLLVFHLSYHAVMYRAAMIIINRWKSGKLQLNVPEELKQFKWLIEPVAQKDAVLKQQRVNQRRMDWGLIANTPAADSFFVDFLREAYPSHADKYITAIQQGGGVNALGQENARLKQQLADAGNMVETFLSEDLLQELPPEDREKLNIMAQNMKGVM